VSITKGLAINKTFLVTTRGKIGALLDWQPAKVPAAMVSVPDLVVTVVPACGEEFAVNQEFTTSTQSTVKSRDRHEQNGTDIPATRVLP
jgi:hypothetical protein